MENSSEIGFGAGVLGLTIGILLVIVTVMWTVFPIFVYTKLGSILKELKRLNSFNEKQNTLQEYNARKAELAQR